MGPGVKDTAMANIKITGYTPAMFQQWQQFVEGSNDGTLFTRLDFLMYHGDRFLDHEHHVVWLNGETLFGIMPMAVFEEEERRVACSPYGGSYGGPAFLRPMSYSHSRQVVAALLDYLTQQRVGRCVLTLPIACCSVRYSDTFRLALIEHGFRCTNREASSVVFLGGAEAVADGFTSSARNHGRRARRAGVITKHRGALEDFWTVLEKTWLGKHGVQPTHTLTEFTWLCDRLPDWVFADVAYLEGKPIAGIGHFVINRRVVNSFYLCQNPEQESAGALSLLVEESLERARAEGFLWFDFGPSSLKMRGRESVFRFKEGFGAIGMFRDTYVWER